MFMPALRAAVTCARSGGDPVLVVAEREQRAGPVQQVRVGVDVHAGHVGERQAQAARPARSSFRSWYRNMNAPLAS